MNKEIDEMINHIRVNIEVAIDNYEVASETCGFILCAYNEYCESERGGNGYIFDVNESINISLKDANELFSALKRSESSKFTLDDMTLSFVTLTDEEVRKILKSRSSEIAKYIVAFPWTSPCDKLYVQFVTDEIIYNKK